LILIDNYDSFTYNVVQYLKELGVEPKVFKNDRISVDELKEMKFESIIISPGPSNPDNAGISLEVIKEFAPHKKILGICLGHQCISQVFGGKIIKAKEPMHAKVSKIHFTQGESLFDGVPQEFLATRYHSLVVDDKNYGKEIIPIAHTKNNVIMGLKHSYYKVFGVQFHPEAILSEYGKTILKNFIDLY